MLHKSDSWPPGPEKVSGQGQEAASAQQSMKDTLRQLCAAGQAEGQCQKKTRHWKTCQLFLSGPGFPGNDKCHGYEVVTHR